MIKFTLRAPLVKAACLFQAKADVRYYLNGFRVEKERMVATNGHILWVHNFSDKLPIDEPLIIQLKGAIPAKAFNLDFEIPGESGVVFVKCDIGKTIAAIYLETIDGRYPDVDRVIPKDDHQDTPQIGFNTEYLGVLSKATKLVGNPKFPMVIAKLHGESSAAEFDINGPEFKSKVILMPTRL